MWADSCVQLAPSRARSVVRLRKPHFESAESRSTSGKPVDNVIENHAAIYRRLSRFECEIKIFRLVETL